MFNDIGALELVALVVLAVLIFGPDKLPKVIQDASRFIRKVRAFSESAKEDIRSELGPEFKDFEFEDLNPKAFIRKQLAENEDLKELRSSFDLKKEINEVADAVNGTEHSGVSDTSVPAAVNGSSSGGPDLLKKGETPARDDRPPFDADAT
ncbi:sec-independent translocase [Streptomyces pristinaespiralis]|uniref:Sec-independent protein translocase protein TatB n=2 Tax=Streptomyces pristinaespiralis TaxID=38300 RepID=B5HA15_STRE2|nr:sec-independent translocase [Streptomyces pristinaespiralis]ALC21032.1 preprotein translocase [Streptomyces pristinaespiralis]EDY63676.1 sec-independent translocase [Streptomyces pristinaespiralis ATCC 25486]QMU16194.1 Sec-independent protein translocase subunit TatB [Streptomyces pristinaespiralis]